MSYGKNLGLASGYGALVCALVLTSSGSFAQQGSLVKVVTDGKPWSMTQTDGTKGQITLLPDGKGQMQIGSMTISPSWREGDGGQLCLKPAFVMPERCATLQREGQVIVGLSNGSAQFRLSRP
jgi:hypothetical protein